MDNRVERTQKIKKVVSVIKNERGKGVCQYKYNQRIETTTLGVLESTAGN